MISIMTESQINWTAGLPENRLFEDHELPLNKDKRYAMSISPASMKLEHLGREVPLRAQTSTHYQKL